MPDKSSKEMYLMYMPLLADLTVVRTFSWSFVVLAYLYRELGNATNSNAKDISGCIVLFHLWARDRFPALAPHEPNFIDPQNNIFGDPPLLCYRSHQVSHSERPDGLSVMASNGTHNRKSSHKTYWIIKVRVVLCDSEHEYGSIHHFGFDFVAADRIKSGELDQNILVDIILIGRVIQHVPSAPVVSK
ncbi:serine/threonine-protein phosphatase 7 long form-like protein [Senna tora]|uniref:Serine/threonine-protein phosphatase 7 long form-like protein n=1 Tax=Senna tora TaxID=362788 RepID=A0A834WIK1_9FABA|nr:serine/threonine-protein phosphatase 7 long form-like protein [Senna tora]